ncbi:MAG: ABC transporter substrate-binding protein [Lautropia sp.]
MTQDAWTWLARRDLLKLIGAGGTALAAGLPTRVLAQARRNTLLLAVDISDTITLDPARVAAYTPPLTLNAAYDTLVTMTPGDYINVKPAIATRWARTPDGKGWRFTLRDGVRFASGTAMTAEDVKWSFDRVINLRDQPSQYVQVVDRVEVVDARTVDIILKRPAAPLLTVIAAPNFGVMDRKLLEQHGGNAGSNAKDDDKATPWLNSNSAGSGPYVLTRWERNVQIQFVRNRNFWRGTVPFERVVVRHLSDSASQLQAVRRGDADAAFNLIPEHVATLGNDKDVVVKRLTSLDFVYMAVTEEPEFNKALAIKEARQAIGYAIDYDGIRDSMLGGAAVRPAHFLPIGVSGSTEEVAQRIRFREDLDRARKLLAAAGYPDGFEFEIAYGNAPVAGVTYQMLAQKIQSDLARVGIKARLSPMDQVNLRTTYTTGKARGGVLTFWNPPAVENEQWASAVVERIAKRVHWSPPADIVDLGRRASEEQDPKQQAELWVQWQERVVDQAHHFILFQPVYQFAVRRSMGELPLTAAGWWLDMYAVRPS